MGFLVLFGLSALAAFTALAIAVRARLRGRAETLVAATLLWNALVVTPIYVLGLTNRLTALSLGLTAPLLSLVALAAATRGLAAPELFRATARAAVGLLRLPYDALALCWRSRSLIFVGVLFATLLLAYLAVSAYLVQPMPHWDPLWYHDTMVGFTIQNHGFAMVPLPDSLQKVNGYVRLGEMTQLWMVIFCDRRLADITNLLFAPAIAAGTYVLARRHAQQLVAVGWAVAVVVMPTCASYLHSTYVDPQYGALLLGGIVFATAQSPRLRDGLLASLGLALTIGSKGLALIPVPVVGIVGAYLLLRAHWRDRRRAALAVVLGGVAAILLVASTTYLRNYWAFHNPLWPDLRVELPKLGIHWNGLGPWSDESADAVRGGMKVNLNEPTSKLVEHLLALPWSIKGMFFDQVVEYGIGVSWVAIPMGAVAFAACVVAALRRLVTGGWPGARRAPLALAIILAAIVKGSPALWGPRYHIGGVGVLVALVAWLAGRPPRHRLGEAAAATVLVTSLMMFWWTPPLRWWYTPDQLIKAAQASPLEREVDQELGAPTAREAGLARERELGPGKLLVFTDRYAGFPSIFWNRHFSNRVLYLPGGADLLARARLAGATWVYLNEYDPQVAAARRPGSGWQEVGKLNWINGGLAFRRVPIPAPPPAAPVAAKRAPAPVIYGPWLPLPPPPPPPPRKGAGAAAGATGSSSPRSRK